MWKGNNPTRSLGDENDDHDGCYLSTSDSCRQLTEHQFIQVYKAIYMYQGLYTY